MEELACEDEEDDEEETDSEQEEEEETCDWSPRRVTPPLQNTLDALLASSSSPEEKDSVRWVFVLAVVIGALLTLRFLYLSLMWSIMTL